MNDTAQLLDKLADVRQHEDVYTFKREWVIDVDIRQREKKAFFAALTESAEKQDDAIMYPQLAKVVKVWPFDGSPADSAAYDELRMSEFAEVVKRVLEAFQALNSKFSI